MTEATETASPTLCSEVALPLDRVLTEGHADACVVLLSESDRPPQGAAGVLDWHLKGAISKSIQQGIFTGKTGECAYLPWNFHGRALHLLLLGVGRRDDKDFKNGLNALHWAPLERNLKGLRQSRWVVSRTEFSSALQEKITSRLPQGGQLWIAQ